MRHLAGSADANRTRSAMGPASRRIPSRSDFQEILEDQMSVLGGNTFRMELHAVHGKAAMRKTHHEMIFGFGARSQFRRKCRSLNNERMIARRMKRPVDAAKDSAAPMMDHRQLSV